jgi:hypothetical protein
LVHEELGDIGVCQTKFRRDIIERKSGCSLRIPVFKPKLFEILDFFMAIVSTYISRSTSAALLSAVEDIRSFDDEIPFR